jgi:hypothetical protein
MEEIFALLPSETLDYLDFFLDPPLFSGIQMSETDYLELIKTVYGSQMATSLEQSIFEITLAVPGTISSVAAPPFAKTTKSASKLTLSLPLAKLLCTNGETNFSVYWN